MLAKEIERKEADLVIVQSALKEIANREAGLPKETARGERPALAGASAGPIGRVVVMQACTIVARNYLPYARVFAQSLTAVHPQAHVTVLVIDGAAEPSDAGLFRTLRLEDVIPDAAERRRQTFLYDVTELSTAVKPLLLQRLLAEGADSVLYFDPDIQVFDSVDNLSRLAADRGIVLTPHMLSPIPDDGFEVSDLAVLRAGVFNLGFIGVGAGTERFLEWWSGRLRRHCISDPANGMFVDQRWLDYVAGLFPHALVDDPGCNVAYWNLHERRVERTASGFDVNGRPLRFFHFSGFDPAVPYLLSRYQGRNPRVLLSERPALRELCDGYAAKLRTGGHCPVAVSYGYSTLAGRHANRSGDAAAVPAGPAGCRASGAAASAVSIRVGRHGAVAELAGAGSAAALSLPVRAASVPGRSAADLSTALRRGSRGVRALGPVRPARRPDHSRIAPAERVVRIVARAASPARIPMGSNGGNGERRRPFARHQRRRLLQGRARRRRDRAARRVRRAGRGHSPSTRSSTTRR